MECKNVLDSLFFTFIFVCDIFKCDIFFLLFVKSDDKLPVAKWYNVTNNQYTEFKSIGKGKFHMLIWISSPRNENYHRQR
jgi:hypothetical protein